MLMLVVTIIIAAVVSAFAGGAVSGAKKPPQAQITAKYSIATGLQISHNGGDAISTNQLIFQIHDGPTFGTGLDQLTSQMLNKSAIYNVKGDPMLWTDGGYNFTSFNPGDVLYIKAPDTTCDLFQPGIAPHPWSVESDGYTYTGATGGKAPMWNLCIRNNNNIGRIFMLEMMDTQGNMIGRTDVVISG
jgi:hypothetical protein